MSENKLLELIDCHCHIHDPSYGKKLATDEVIKRAVKAGVKQMICVGTSLVDSQNAVNFVQNQTNCFASVGIHPHEASQTIEITDWQQQLTLLSRRPKVVAIGEIGLDFYYRHSPSQTQIELLEKQLELAVKTKLPVIFHVRQAFREFWPIFDNFPGIRGVIHSFSATSTELKPALKRQLFIGLNGIMTFTKDPQQLAAAKLIPNDRLILETDAPFLTPAPFRGIICEPKHLVTTAQFLADLRGQDFADLAYATSTNAQNLFQLN